MELIDRQAVIDEIKFSNGMVRRGVVYVRVDELVNKLRALPSAQPEIIRCKDCKHCKHLAPLISNYCMIFEFECSADDFCSSAKRRTDG